MSCHDREQDLLLLEHGELPLMPRIALQAHLRRCPRCRESRERLGAVSGLLAEAIRGSALPAWTPVAVRPTVVSARTPLRLAVALSMLLLITVVAAAVLRSGRPAGGTSPAGMVGPPPMPCGGCPAPGGPCAGPPSAPPGGAPVGAKGQRDDPQRQ